MLFENDNKYALKCDALVKQDGVVDSAAAAKQREAAVKLAKEVFREADGDSSGCIDKGELNIMVRKLFQGLGQCLPDDIEGMVQKAMSQFGSGRGIEYSEWVKMLVHDPWYQLLPDGVAAELQTTEDLLTRDQEGLPVNSRMSRESFSPRD